MPRTKTRLCSVLMLVLVALPASFTAQKKDKARRKGKCRHPAGGDLAGSGRHALLEPAVWRRGKENAPNTNGPFTFVKEDLQETSPKFDVKDDQGVAWQVKLGQEPQSETAATRFLWAAGYFVDEDYYLPELKVTGLPKLQRGENFVSAGGTVH